MSWNSTLTRRTPLRAKKPWRRPDKKPIDRKTVLTAKKPMKRRGKKTAAWENCRAKLKPRFERAGITVCEFQFSGCWRDNGLGFAHSRKRRNVTTPELLEECALTCNVCHDIAEAWPEEKMMAFVRRVIADRSIPV